MKKILSIAALSLLSLSSLLTAPAQAQAVFNVGITLTSVCEISTGPAPVVFPTYTSFQVGSTNSTGGAFKIKCTNTLPYTLALDTLAIDGTEVADGDTALKYTLTLKNSGGTTVSSTTANIGNGLAAGEAFTIVGFMGGTQSGNCTALGGSCDNALGSNNQRTLTISY